MMKKKWWSILLNIAMVFVLVLAIGFLVMNTITAPIIVDGNSMNPTLNNLDYGKMNVSKIKRKNLDRFDIVVFDAILPGDDKETTLIKRIIGLPGETISVNEVTGELTVDGKVVIQKFLSDEYVRLTCNSSRGLACGEDLLIPEGHYYVLGDNRNNSMDSEHGLGLISRESVIGTLWVIYAKCESIKEEKSNVVCVGKKYTHLRFF